MQPNVIAKEPQLHESPEGDQKRKPCHNETEPIASTLANYGVGGFHANSPIELLAGTLQTPASLSVHCCIIMTAMSEGPKRDWRVGTAVIALGMGAGAFVWFASPWLTGELEPWDAEGSFYYWYLFAVGIVAGALAPRWLWAFPLGIYAGQFVGMCNLPKFGPLMALGFFFMLPLMSLFSLGGAFLGAGVRWLIAWTARRARGSLP